MKHLDSPHEIISPQLFKEYSAKWLTVVSQPSVSPLAQAFSNAAGERILYVSFPVSSIVGLLSAIGVHQIKARFLLVPGESAGAQDFSIALFAADTKGDQVSAYYIGTPGTKGQGYRMPSTFAPAARNEHVPGELASIWLRNWQDAGEVKPAMFTVNLVTLQGYNFNLIDFMVPLPRAQARQQQEIRVYLALHAYHAPDSTGELTEAFGLVVLSKSANPRGGTDEDDSINGDDVFLDLATPCPPNF
ncbi:hypothetical protein I2I05_10125 [Hymenobacter sp. BT683]|uniref:Uncharacterized protein n=1 Tax=Hymenobacter jeongseonensis TaxID=2791027 RepID=A0ABS0IHA9_9BACT|nr:hypothetical protein [Hymenobacter jeongseonensis]MBF9237750.1 hypothetical protein [Hymenobacter jeongseonensis]